MSVVADTHALIWYLLNRASLSPAARAAMVGAIEGSGSVLVSAISFAEIVYLMEKARLPGNTLREVLRFIDQPDGQILSVPITSDVAQQVARVPRHEVPDMPDRIIAATALALGVPLVTRDRRIRSSAVTTIW